MAHGAAHAAAVLNVDFPLGLQGFPCGTTHAPAGGHSIRVIPRPGDLCENLVFPMVSACFGETVFRVFFGLTDPGQNPLFLQGF